jgi:hypothetical protein
MRKQHSIAKTEAANALTISDVREEDYDYVSISQEGEDRFVIVSREQLPALIRQLWKIAATR